MPCSPKLYKQGIAALRKIDNENKHIIAEQSFRIFPNIYLHF